MIRNRIYITLLLTACVTLGLVTACSSKPINPTTEQNGASAAQSTQTNLFTSTPIVPTPTPLPPTATPVPTPVTIGVINDIRPVSAHDFVHIDINVTFSETEAVTLTGVFTTTGGSGNDIEALLLTERDFINWSNDHEDVITPVYQSGRLTTSRFDAPVPVPGTYFLVFDNTFSLFASKVVEVFVSQTTATRNE